MADKVVEVTSQSWFSRIIESIKGIFVGIILFLLAFPLLFWNEGRAVKTARSLDEGSSSVISVGADTVDPGNEGKLIHISGLATTTETLSDGVFGVSLQALKLEREVEMFQWKEDEKKEKRKKVGGGEETVTTYTYATGWYDEVIDSSRFKEPDGHYNPGAMAYDSASWTAGTVTDGAFTLSDSLVGQITSWEKIPMTAETLATTGPELSQQLQLVDGQYFIGAAPTAPRVGDLRIGFQAVKPTVVSIVAKQVGSALRPYEPHSSSYTIELLEMGTMSADEMFAAAKSRNSMMTWVLRLVGFVMMFAGLSMVGRPFAVVADFIPFIGSFFRIGIGLFAFLLSFGFSFVTIAIAWVFYRPLLGILLLSLGALGFVGLAAAAITIGRKRMKPAEEATA